jgi:hypothetical protein
MRAIWRHRWLGAAEGRRATSGRATRAARQGMAATVVATLALASA